ncbi:MAG: preprotein translocase subunit SecE [Candidatus Hydrothermales bacterium]
MNLIFKTINFLKEVKIEMERMAWPEKKLVMSATFGVIIFSIIVSVFIFLLDFIFSRIISLVLR